MDKSLDGAWTGMRVGETSGKVEVDGGRESRVTVVGSRNETGFFLQGMSGERLTLG